MTCTDTADRQTHGQTDRTDVAYTAQRQMVCKVK